MGRVDETSIHIDRLANMWRMNMKRRGSIKDGGGSKIGDGKIKERNTVAVYNQICNVTLKLYIRTSVLGFRRGCLLLQYTLVCFHSFVIKPIVRGVGCASGIRPPAALSPSFLNKRVGTGPAST